MFLYTHAYTCAYVDLDKRPFELERCARLALAPQHPASAFARTHSTLVAPLRRGRYSPCRPTQIYPRVFALLALRQLLCRARQSMRPAPTGAKHWRPRAPQRPSTRGLSQPSAWRLTGGPVAHTHRPTAGLSPSRTASFPSRFSCSDHDSSATENLRCEESAGGSQVSQGAPHDLGQVRGGRLSCERSRTEGCPLHWRTSSCVVAGSGGQTRHSVEGDPSLAHMACGTCCRSRKCESTTERVREDEERFMIP